MPVYSLSQFPTDLAIEASQYKRLCIGRMTLKIVKTEFCEKSGAKAGKPAFDRMMKLVREGNVERVVCYSFSRYARSVTHLLTALEVTRLEIPLLGLILFQQRARRRDDRLREIRLNLKERKK